MVEGSPSDCLTRVQLTIHCVIVYRHSRDSLRGQKMNKLLLAAVSCLGLYPGIAVNAQSSKTITAQEFGDEWPFEVESGLVSCVNGSVLFTVEGKQYAVNGTAEANGYAEIEEIWSFNPEMLAFQKELAREENKTLEQIQQEMGGTPRVSISAVLNAGLELCN